MNIDLENLFAQLADRIQQLKKDKSAVLESRRVVENALGDGKLYYGINTGFGALAHKKIEPEQLTKLQHNLLYSHAVGVGELIPKEICRLMLLLKIHGLSLGFSGVSEKTFDRLLDFAEKDLIPAIPSRGSLGASGDLAPLAHLSLPLIGAGYFWNPTGERTLKADAVLKEQGLEPIELQPKDGLALCNGTQMMTAYGAHVLSQTNTLLKNADILAAMSLEALKGSIQPFHEKIHNARPYKGSIAVAGNIRNLLRESEILESHRNCGKVQDPYSLRCVPQVHGASRDALDFSRSIVETEINSATDNPLVFGEGEIISGGNFHGQPLALAFDFAAIALAEMASISERRTYLLLSGHDGLPKFLLKETGINSGLMVLQYTAAALVSENKVLCHPASVDSIPTCLGQEDHVSMGSISALKLFDVFNNVQNVLAIEAFVAAQALDFREPVRPGKGVEAAHRCIRSEIAHREVDESFDSEIPRTVQLLQNGSILKQTESAIGNLD